MVFSETPSLGHGVRIESDPGIPVEEVLLAVGDVAWAPWSGGEAPVGGDGAAEAPLSGGGAPPTGAEEGQSDSQAREQSADLAEENMNEENSAVLNTTGEELLTGAEEVRKESGETEGKKVEELLTGAKEGKKERGPRTGKNVKVAQRGEEEAKCSKKYMTALRKQLKKNGSKKRNTFK